mgnify:CR=1 FL=1
MSRKYQDDSSSGVGTVIGVLSVVAMAGLAAALYYLKAGVGEADAAFIPNTIEGRIDRVVAALNQRFGKEWVSRRLSELTAAIQAALPAPLVGFVDVVYQAEQFGKAYRWNGQQKLCHAVGQCNQ